MVMMMRPGLLSLLLPSRRSWISPAHAEREIAQNAGHDVNLFDSEAWISMWLAYRVCPSAPHHRLP